MGVKITSLAFFKIWTFRAFCAQCNKDRMILLLLICSNGNYRNIQDEILYERSALVSTVAARKLQDRIYLRPRAFACCPRARVGSLQVLQLLSKDMHLEDRGSKHSAGVNVSLNG